MAGADLDLARTVMPMDAADRQRQEEELMEQDMEEAMRAEREMDVDGQ